MQINENGNVEFFYFLYILYIPISRIYLVSNDSNVDGAIEMKKCLIIFARRIELNLYNLCETKEIAKCFFYKILIYYNILQIFL